MTRPRARRQSRAQGAYTIAEVVVAIVLVSLVAGPLFLALSTGVTIVELTRENLRATQILTQKTETLRLLTWPEGTNSTFAPQQFVDSYDPNSPNKGVTYQGFVVPSPAPATFPAAYRNDMRLVTVTVYWTNYLRGSKTPLVRSRQMQTCVARYGLQNYIYSP